MNMGNILQKLADPYYIVMDLSNVMLVLHKLIHYVER